MVFLIDVRGAPAAICRAYDLFSHFYGFTVARLEKPAIARGLQKAKVRTGERVLEVAAGVGKTFQQLSGDVGPTGFAVALDIAPRMLAAARRRQPRAILVRADARKLPFAEAAFDLLWSSYFLDLIPTAELTPILREFLRVLRPGGRLLLIDFSKQQEGLIWWERFYLHTPARLVPYLFGSCRPICAERFLREAGFETIDREFLRGRMPSEIVLARKGGS